MIPRAPVGGTRREFGGGRNLSGGGLLLFGRVGLAGGSECDSRRARGERGEGHLVDDGKSERLSHVLFHGTRQPSAILACSARESSRGAVAGWG